MVEMGCRVTAAPFYWCPACGTMKTCNADGGAVAAVPGLVETHKRLGERYERFAEAVGVAARAAARDFALLK